MQSLQDLIYRCSDCSEDPKGALKGNDLEITKQILQTERRVAVIVVSMERVKEGNPQNKAAPFFQYPVDLVYRGSGLCKMLQRILADQEIDTLIPQGEIMGIPGQGAFMSVDQVYIQVDIPITPLLNGDP
jgi:hypothetical protein